MLLSQILSDLLEVQGQNYKNHQDSQSKQMIHHLQLTCATLEMFRIS